MLVYFEAIGQELLDGDREPLAVGDDRDIQIMQIHSQVLLDKKEGHAADYFWPSLLPTRALGPDHQ